MLTGFQNRSPPRRNVDQHPPTCPKVGFSSLGRPAVGGPREGKKAITPHRFGGPAGRTAANSDTERNGDLLLARRLGPPHHIRQGGTTWTASGGPIPTPSRRPITTRGIPRCQAPTGSPAVEPEQQPIDFGIAPECIQKRASAGSQRKRGGSFRS